MSNIVIDESRILQLEEDRVTLRNNLREQGIGCKDDETLESLIAKVEDIPSPKKVIHKEITSYIDDELTDLSTEYFSNNPNLENLEIDNLERISVPIRYCGCKKLYLPKITSIDSQYQFSYNNNMTKLCLSGLISTSNSLVSYDDALKYLDVGLITSMSSGAPVQMFTTISNCSNLRYLISRSKTLIPINNKNPLTNTPFSSPSGNAKFFIPQVLVGQYSIATNWSTKYFTEISLEGSRFESPYWMKKNNSLCTLDGNIIEVNDDETAVIFKHTENISHCYENGVELADTDLVKGKTLTSTI